MNQRQTSIVEYITEHGKTEVHVLADIFHVSDVTLRKDLDCLVKQGVIHRERGYALPSCPEDINYHMAFQLGKKQKIAKAAADVVRDGETIMIESSSTCALFAEELAKRYQHINIVTNSLYLSNYVCRYPSVQITLLGGTLQPQSQSLVGPITKDAVRFFHIKKMFTGTDGYSKEFGFMGDDLIRADTLQAMIDVCDYPYVLTTSDKFSHPGTVSFLKLEKVYGVVTDPDISDEESQFLKSKGIEIKIAE